MLWCLTMYLRCINCSVSIVTSQLLPKFVPIIRLLDLPPFCAYDWCFPMCWEILISTNFSRCQGHTSRLSLKLSLEREWAIWLVMQHESFVPPKWCKSHSSWHPLVLQGCILDCAEMMDIVVKKGSWYSYEDHRFVFGLTFVVPGVITSYSSSIWFLSVPEG